MALYEKRLARDLARLGEEVARLGEMVLKAQQNAVGALLNGNTRLANQIVLGDHPINRQFEEVTQLAHAFMALHLPSAGYLREVSSVLRLANELERIGDYAVTISRECLQLRNGPKGILKRELEMIANQAHTSLKQALTAYSEKNAKLARATMEVASQVKRERDIAFADFVKEGDRQRAEIKDILYLFVTMNMIKRVGDRAKNICEQTLFAVSGKTKDFKVHRILFLDEENSCQSQLAEAISRRAFPNRAVFASAGRRRGAALHPGLSRFMEEHGLNSGSHKPQSLESHSTDLQRYGVIVSLQGPVESYLDQQPFRTVFLDWDVGEPPTEQDPSRASEVFAEMYREITVRVSDLMEILSGEHTD